MTSAQAPGGAFVQGHSAAAPPPPLAPGQQPQNALVHPWLARREGRADAFVKSHESSNSCFPFGLTHSLMVFLFTLTATEPYSQEKKKNSLACITVSGKTSLRRRLPSGQTLAFQWREPCPSGTRLCPRIRRCSLPSSNPIPRRFANLIV